MTPAGRSSLILATPSSPRSSTNVGSAELAGQLLAGRMAAHGDDALGAQLAGSQHGQQPDRQQARGQLIGREIWGCDQGAVGQRDP
jgi:hypothetical protein